MQVMLFANGVITLGSMLQSRLDELVAPYVLCADGGALHARALGYTPRTIIGDLDSLTAEQVAAFKTGGAEILQYPPDKDETDLELALHYCTVIGASAVTIVGGLGGRFDQTVANILLLSLPELRDIQVEFVDGDQAMRLLQPGAHQIVGQPGDTISLIPLGARAEGITSSDLQYPLRGETLNMGPARGISNVMLSDQAVIEFNAGLLLLVHTIGRA